MNNAAVELKVLMAAGSRLTLSVAESMTCGNVQAMVGAVSGASDYFLGGITAYTLQQKVRHLGVDRVLAERDNCVSEEIAKQMAQGACELFESDLGLATTGYAEKPPADRGDEPYAWWGLAHRGLRGFLLRSGKVQCGNADRREAQTMVAGAAIAELVSYLRAIGR